MLLAMDIGNTETKLGLFDLGESSPRRTWRIMTDPRRTGDEIATIVAQLFTVDALRLAQVDAVVVASVVPKLDLAVGSASMRLFSREPLFLRADEQNMMPIRTERAAEVGADLVASALGGRARFGAPLIVVSYGTATVFTAIDADGAYAGAAIAPGIQTSIDALIGRTAKLPQIALSAPDRAIGRETVAALQSGIIFGFVGQTEGLAARFRAELGASTCVVATGGLADVIASHTTSIDHVSPYLSLEGLRLFHDEQSL